MFRLMIDYDPNTDSCQVQGIPCLNTPDGQNIPLRGICYGALEKAKEVIANFKPEEKPAIAIARAMPGLLRNGQ